MPTTNYDAAVADPRNALIQAQRDDEAIERMDLDAKLTKAYAEGRAAERTDIGPILELALRFTIANDRGDAASERLEDYELSEEDEGRYTQISEQSDVDYNETKALLFEACRKFLGAAERATKPLEDYGVI